MDEIIVGIIVAGAVAFTIKSFINTYQGKKSCDCGTGCSCASKKSCPPGFLKDK
ncbi:FeoB-associated Cys-rich membrane protein [Desulfobacula sp.]|uniref:FeoB-associated Cys-rich membrane protein n=1 Tax=Desulfobacula sp. TaxID=2593537 RepID=UPI0025C693A1|nr:FeoB-associated Cys-rich membrane protein [Desulfobacula sp.]MBC2703424.1 FeoB-associated Cys-rich membrane protein [Desulfobacula sp.]